MKLQLGTEEYKEDVQRYYDRYSRDEKSIDEHLAILFDPHKERYHVFTRINSLKRSIEKLGEGDEKARREQKLQELEGQATYLDTHFNTRGYRQEQKVRKGMHQLQEQITLQSGEERERIARE